MLPVENILNILYISKEGIAAFPHKTRNKLVTLPLHWQTFIRVPPARQLTTLVQGYERFIIFVLATQTDPQGFKFLPAPPRLQAVNEAQYGSRPRHHNIW